VALIAADVPWWQLRQHVREALARVKAIRLGRVLSKMGGMRGEGKFASEGGKKYQG
jgi:hypothetical protein